MNGCTSCVIMGCSGGDHNAALLTRNVKVTDPIKSWLPTMSSSMISSVTEPLGTPTVRISMTNHLCAVLCYAMRCCAMLCDAMLCDAMPCYAMLCYAMLVFVQWPDCCSTGMLSIRSLVHPSNHSLLHSHRHALHANQRRHHRFRTHDRSTTSCQNLDLT